MKPLANSNRVWVGKASGAAIGLLSGGPFGLVIGAIAGHLLDRLAEKARSGPAGPMAQEHMSALFRVMGHLAKADGRISEKEIAAAEGVIEALGMIGDRRALAIRLFGEGKQSSYRLERDLKALEAGLPPNQHEVFFSLLVKVARADGRVKRAQRKVLKQVGRAFGIPPFRFYWWLSRGEGSTDWEKKARPQERAQQTSQPRRPELMMSREVRRAFNVLGLAPDVSDEELKQTFRRLMSEYHPDKLVARGVSAAELERAKSKAQEIQSAYAIIRKHRRASK